MNKLMPVQTDNSISGTILTIFFSFISIQDIDLAAKIIATLCTATAGITTAIYTYNKNKKLKNEKDTNKH
jgi:hypothetical protein